MLGIRGSRVFGVKPENMGFSRMKGAGVTEVDRATERGCCRVDA